MHEAQCSRVGLVCAWLVAVMAIAGAIGCVPPTSADFRLANVGAGQAAIAGRLTIIYNGQIYTENCYATFGGHMLKMAKGGIVLFAVPEGQTSLERLDCKDVSNQHIEIKNVHFVASGHGVVTDFGDVAVTWEAAGGFKVSSMFGLIGALVDEASDDGVAMVAVRPPVAEVRDAFRAQTGVEGTWTESLASAVAVAPAHVELVPVVPPAPVGAPVAGAPRAPAQGFSCTSAGAQSSLNLCARTPVACEQIRDRLVGHDLTACAPAATAWCFATPDNTHCFDAQPACEAQSKKFDASGPCHEQH